MITQVYFTYKPYKNDFKIEGMSEDYVCYINMLNATDEEILKHHNNMIRDKKSIDKKVLYVIDKMSFEDHKVKVIYILKRPINYYICLRAYLQDAYTISCCLNVKNLSFDQLIDGVLIEQDDESIPFHLLE